MFCQYSELTGLSVQSELHGFATLYDGQIINIPYHVLLPVLWMICGHLESVPWFEKVSCAANRGASSFGKRIAELFHVTQLERSTACLLQSVTAEAWRVFSFAVHTSLAVAVIWWVDGSLTLDEWFRLMHPKLKAFLMNFWPRSSRLPSPPSSDGYTFVDFRPLTGDNNVCRRTVSVRSAADSSTGSLCRPFGSVLCRTVESFADNWCCVNCVQNSPLYFAVRKSEIDRSVAMFYRPRSIL